MQEEQYDENGIPQEPIGPTEPTEPTPFAESTEPTAPFEEDQPTVIVARYNILQVVKTLFSSPVDGLRTILANGGQMLDYALAFIGFTFLAVTLLGMVMVSGESDLDSDSTLMAVKVGLSSAIFSVVVSILLFLVKTISGKGNFKADLLAGSLCGIPLTLQFLLLYLLIKLGGSDMMMGMLSGPFTSPPILFLYLVLLFGLLFMLNIIQQSLLASGKGNTGSWYIAPLVFLGAMCIAGSIAKAIIFASFDSY